MITGTIYSDIDESCRIQTGTPDTLGILLRQAQDLIPPQRRLGGDPRELDGQEISRQHGGSPREGFSEKLHGGPGRFPNGLF